MSFDIFCIAWENGDRGVGDAAAALAVLRSRVQHLDETEGYFALEFNDGSFVALCADGLAGSEKPFDGGMFHLTGGSWTLTAMQLIYDFASAGRLIIVPQDPPRAILPFEELRVDLPPNFLRDPEPIVVRNGHELGLAVSGRIDELPALKKPQAEGNADGG